MVIATAVFTAGFVFVSDSEVSAAKKPGMVRSLSITGITTNSATIKWSKVKGASGYVLYKNGKYFRTTGAGTRTYSDKSLKASTRYTYSVKAYKKVKQKQWYNKKTKKWQKKKPKKKNRGKSRKVTVKLYGASSKKCTFTTQGYIEHTFKTKYGTTVKSSQCKNGYSFYEPSTLCEVCKSKGKTAGVYATVTFSANQFKAAYQGFDYSDDNNCHHHDHIQITGRCGKDAFFTGEGRISLQKAEIVNDQDPKMHSHNYPDKAKSELITMTIARMKAKDDSKYSTFEWVEQGGSFRYKEGNTFENLSAAKIAEVLGSDTVICPETPTYVEEGKEMIYCYSCDSTKAKPTDW